MLLPGPVGPAGADGAPGPPGPTGPQGPPGPGSNIVAVTDASRVRNGVWADGITVASVTLPPVGTSLVVVHAQAEVDPGGTAATCRLDGPRHSVEPTSVETIAGREYFTFYTAVASAPHLTSSWPPNPDEPLEVKLQCHGFNSPFTFGAGGGITAWAVDNSDELVDE
jgi:hypothetical protein